MTNKLILLLLLGVWFKIFNVLFYSFFDIPVAFVIGEGMNFYKVYWIVLFVGSTIVAYKILRILNRLNNRRIAKMYNQ